MKIRIRIEWTRRTTPTHFYTLRSVLHQISTAITPLWTHRSLSTHLRCAVLGHQTQLKLGQQAMLLECKVCGWTSPGWNLQPDRARRRKVSLPESKAVAQ